MSELRVYNDFARDKSGYLGGLSGPQLSVLVLAGLPILIAFGTQQWLLAALWVLLYAGVAAVVVVPVRGRPAFRWLADLAWTVLGRVMGISRWSAQAAETSVEDLDDPDLPGTLAGISTHDGPPYGTASTRVVLIQDKARQTWAVTASISHPGITFANAHERDRMGNGLAQLQEVAARAELVETIALQIRTVPDDGAERAVWEDAHTRPDAPAVALEVAQDLNRWVSAAGVRAEGFVTIVVPERRIKKQAKDSGGGIDGRARVMHALMREIEGLLSGAMGCTSVTWLDAAGLGEATRTGFAPGDSGLLAAARMERPGTAGATQPMALAGPSAAAASPRSYKHDAWASATCSVQVPDQGAVMGALAPIFTPSLSGERRSATVFYRPLDRRSSDSAVRRAENSSELGASLVDRLGFKPRARQRLAAEQVAQQDEKVARGRAVVRCAMVAAVTVPVEMSVIDAGRRLETSIRSSGFLPLRLDLAQDSGFVAACIPMGIGMPRRRGLRP